MVGAKPGSTTPFYAPSPPATRPILFSDLIQLSCAFTTHDISTLGEELAQLISEWLVIFSD